MAPLIGLIIACLCVALLARFLRRAPSGTPRRVAAKGIVVDGTNVLFWRGNVAELATLRRVVSTLKRRGFDPVVFLDASSRHHLGDRSLDAKGFARALALPRGRVTVCPARTEADVALLQHARKHRLAVVSNDRFRDHARAARNIRLVKGRIEAQRVVLKGL